MLSIESRIAVPKADAATWPCSGASSLRDCIEPPRRPDALPRLETGSDVDIPEAAETTYMLWLALPGRTYTRLMLFLFRSLPEGRSRAPRGICVRKVGFD